MEKIGTQSSDAFSLVHNQEALSAANDAETAAGKAKKLVDTPSNSTKFVQKRLFSGSIIVVACMIILSYVVDTAKQEMNSEMLDLEELESMQSSRYGEIDPAAIRRAGGEDMRQNPSISSYEKMFCTGYRTSSFCKERVLHPYISVLERFGVKYKSRKKRERLYKKEHYNNRISLG